MGKEGYERMKRFYEESEVGHQMAAPLKQKAVAYVEFQGDDQIYELIKIENRSVLRPKESERAEIFFKFSRGSIDYLFEPPSENVEDYINRLCDCMLEKDPSKKVEMQLLTSIVDGWRKGYIAMMKLGGTRAIATVARIGIRIPGKFIKDKTDGNDNDD
ncbi:MAG: hypothetical protein ABIH66_00915 [bacterium]